MPYNAPSQTDWSRLADRSIAGELITREEARAVLNAPDSALLDQLAAAYRVRQATWGNRVRLHFLLNAQSGLCPEDCGYCSQSKISAAEIEKYPMMAQERIMEAADRAAELKAGTLCMVISGRSPGETVFGKVLDAVRAVRSESPDDYPRARPSCGPRHSGRGDGHRARDRRRPQF